MAQTNDKGFDFSVNSVGKIDSQIQTFASCHTPKCPFNQEFKKKQEIICEHYRKILVFLSCGQKRKPWENYKENQRM